MLEIVIWDVQHGSAAYIKTPARQHLAVDLGTGSGKQNDATFSPLLHLKYVYKVQRLDGVIITHPHKDHLDDIANFDELYPRVLHRPNYLSREDIMAGNKASDSLILEEYLKIDKRYSDPVPEVENPFFSNNNGGTQIQLFSPSASPRNNLNNHSIVTLVSYAHSKVLIPGDNEALSWKELLRDDYFKNAIRNTDVLIAPHHGRASGYSPELFEVFNPYLTIISDGDSCETSVTSNYNNVTRGWEVHKRSGGTEKRKCLSTRQDGCIYLQLGFNDDTPFLAVFID